MAHIRRQFLHNLYKLVDLCIVGFSFFLAVPALSYQCSGRLLAYHVRFFALYSPNRRSGE